MKFANINIGDQFEYQGERYQKTNSLIASHLDTGKQKLFKRSTAILSLTQKSAPETIPTDDIQINISKFHAAINKYHNKSIETLKQLDQAETTVEQSIDALNTAKKEIYKTICISPIQT